MDNIWLWILISLVIGVIAGLVFTSATRKMSQDDPDDENSEDDGEKSSTHGNMVLTIVVFSVIAFLILWLVFAVMDRGLV